MCEPILLTTAISYTNGSPHVGHLYEAVLADFIKNLYKINGNEIKLLTGTDEHGKKIQSTAEKLNIKPIELCDKYSKEFQTMDEKLQVSYDLFIRTSNNVHKNNVIEIIKKIQKNKPESIFLGEYSGYYNIREEIYVTETQASQTNYCDPVTLIPYEIINEPSYYFKLNLFIDDINKTLLKIKPYHFHDEIANRLKKGLEDLSITRTTFNWGIDFPDTEDHVLYVWFDALLNYVTGKNILYENKKVKPIHLIGKDILWFHSVIYPAILAAAELDDLFPEQILTHGFILDKDGKKQSKSLGNVINIDDLINSYPTEAIRYYLITNTIFGQDFKFDEENLVNSFNNILIKEFGNLFQRITKIAKPLENELNNYFNNSVDYIKVVQQENKNIVGNLLEKWNIIEYNEHLNNLISKQNKNLTENKPWTIEDINEKTILIGNILIDFHSILCLIFPIIPAKVNELANYWGWEDKINFNENITLKFKECEKIIAFNRIEIKKEIKINKKNKK